MENIIKRLIDIDKNARTLVKNANESSTAAIEEIEKKKQKLRDENEVKFASMLEQEKAKQKATLERVEKEIEQTGLRHIDEFNSLYKEKGAQWISSIVENVIRI
ncbi:MAG: hypothetical protein NC122_07660 [Faecalibacterium sp.]|nr:hypothetical protein [Ruminococcus sp.]MCM1392624.1 hypothetical protein [Ruminococcus sp.]MCM1486069.1 hypothetical protein [Faecalibacterium sp.]